MEGHRQRIRGLDDCKKIGYGGGGGLREMEGRGNEALRIGGS